MKRRKKMLKYMFKLTGKAFNFVVAFIMLLALCAVDSASWIPFIVFIVSAAYLMAVAWWQEKRYLESEDEQE